MAYPRACAGCGASYDGATGTGSSPYVTLAAQDGGTPSPWLASKPGRLLDLRCELCGAVFRWDYFGKSGETRLGQAVALLRGPRSDWERRVPAPGRTGRRTALLART